MSTPASPVESAPNGVLLHLLIQPRASRSDIVGMHDGRIKVRLAAPPVDGAANEALVAFLSKALGVTRSAVEIVAGQTGRRKTVVVEGLSVEKATSLVEGSGRFR